MSDRSTRLRRGNATGVYDDGDVPTLGQLHRSPPRWVWIHCHACLYRLPLPLAPFVIRWGPDASSNLMRRNFRCSKCGARSTAIQVPSFTYAQGGYDAFPVDIESVDP